MDSPPASRPRPRPRPRPSPLPRTPPPQSRLAGPSDTADVERRYTRRSARAALLTHKHLGQTLASPPPPPPQPRPYEAAESSESARRYPLRSNRKPPSSSQRVQPPPPSSRKSTSDDAQHIAGFVDSKSQEDVGIQSEFHGPQQGSSETTSDDKDNRLIKINTEELHSSLDTLGVSVQERKKILSTVSRKCLAVYNAAVLCEKDRCMTMVKAISVLENQISEIGSVLGESQVIPEDYQRSACLSEIHKSFTTQLMRLNLLKKQRLQNLQIMQTKIVDLWDHLGVTLQQQREFRDMMRNASSEEVTEKDALSADVLSKTQAELKRLKGQMIHEIAKRFAVLADNLQQTHLSGDRDYEVKFTLLDVKAGRIDMFSAANVLEDLITKSSRDILQRADIVDRAEAFFNSRKESSSHNEAKGNDLIDRVQVWENKNERKFVYDKGHLIAQLREPKKDEHYEAITGPGEEAGCDKTQSPTWSDSWAGGSEKSESDDENDLDFVGSESEEEA